MKTNRANRYNRDGSIRHHANLDVIGAVLNMWRRSGGYQSIQITGNSMLPLIRNGDHVLVILDCDNLQIGDVAVFQRDGRLTAHRVIGVLANEVGPTFITKGDNAFQLDPPWSRDQLLGQVMAIDRGSNRLNLDSFLWRLFGRCIAINTPLWVKWEEWGAKWKQRLFGPEPNRFTAWLRRKACCMFNGCSRTVRAAFCHWKV